MRLKSTVLLAAITSSTLVAQGSQPPTMTLQGGYHAASIGSRAGLNGCGNASASRGVFQFPTSGSTSFSFTGTNTDVNTGGGGSGPLQFSGSYTLGGDGSIQLVQSGNAYPLRGQMGVERDIAVFTRTASTPLDQEAYQVLMVKESTSATNATLNGTYALRWLRLTADQTRGIVGANGGSAYTFQGNGSGSAGTSGLTYSVASNGGLSLQFGTSGTGSGAVSPGGDLFYFVSTNSSSVSLFVGVKQTTAQTTNQLRGRWLFSAQGHANEFDPNYQPPTSQVPTGAHGSRTSTTLATTTLVQDMSGSRHTMEVATVDSLSLFTPPNVIVTCPGGNFTTVVPPFSLAGPATVSAAGSLALLDNASSTIFTGQVNQRGDVFVGSLPGEITLCIGLRTTYPPVVFGSVTYGLCGPSLVTYSFPRLGNAQFGLLLTLTPAGNLAVVGVSLLPTSGLPIVSGLMWIDPATLLFTDWLVLFGATATLCSGWGLTPLPIPLDPALEGLELFGQAFVVDVGAPGGVAMSNGLGFTLQR